MVFKVLALGGFSLWLGGIASIWERGFCFVRAAARMKGFAAPSAGVLLRFLRCKWDESWRRRSDAVLAWDKFRDLDPILPSLHSSGFVGLSSDILICRDLSV